jgi:uncharacterized phage-associated protein
MAKVFDVAKYIVESFGEIDTWKLQKLVYYCQAWSVVWDDRPLFDSRIEAWANGPVCPELFSLHKGYFKVNPSLPMWNQSSSANLTDTEKETIDAVLRDYGSKNGYWLRMLTHTEDPWLQARGDTPRMVPCNNEITIDSMGLYYGSL